MTGTTTPSTTLLTDAAWTPDPADDAFAQPFVDIDEWRDWPVRHRYVHGGFHDNETRFSMYLPPVEQFEGRFFQHVTPVPQSENLAQSDMRDQNPVAFSIDSGAYFLETNGGGSQGADPTSGADPTIAAYRANAAAARLSRQIAERIYGSQRIYGYLYGGSGGGYRTIGASENTHDVWDGFVPYVIGSPMAMPNVFAIRMHAQRILRNKFPDIVDAYDVGGDPSALSLTDEEREAFTEVTRMGFPVRSWFGWETMGMHGFSALYPGVLAADPTYADEFWNVDGYLGSDPTASVHRDRIQLATRISELFTPTASSDARPSGGVDESFTALNPAGSAFTGARLRNSPAGWAIGAELRVLSGAAAGETIRLSNVVGDRVEFEPGQNTAALAAGDDVVLDNSRFLAAQTYHRHQVPSDGYPTWDQFRDADGQPNHPQRGMLLGPLFAASAAGTVQTGRITGKMIVVASLLDREAFPWQADWYRTQVRAFLGDTVDDRFRLWFTDNALHGDESSIQEHETRTISYLGALETALRQLSAWVERGIDPSANTTYEIVDGQVLVSPTDAARGGVQPVVTITANGSAAATVRAGEPVAVQITATAAVGAGVIVQVATDLAGAGTLDAPFNVRPSSSVSLERTVSFAQPGTYFLAARVAAQTGNEDAADPHARVFNIGRARVTVAP